MASITSSSSRAISDALSYPDGAFDVVLALGLFTTGGIDAPITSEYVPDTHSIRSGDDWWTIVLGTGMRGVVDGLDPAAAERVRVDDDLGHRRCGHPRARHRRDLHRRHQVTSLGRLTVPWHR